MDLKEEDMDGFVRALNSDKSNEHLQSEVYSFRQSISSALASRIFVEKRSRTSSLIWSLRSALWSRIDASQQSNSSLVQLICCLWDVQVLCEHFRLFSDFIDSLSAQYNVVRKLIEKEAMVKAIPRSRSLFLCIIQKIKKHPASEPEFVDYPRCAAQNNEKLIKTALAIFITVLSGCSSGIGLEDDKEWLKYAVCALLSFEAWSRELPKELSTYKNHINCALYHSEKILSLINRMPASQIEDQRSIRSMVVSFVRLSRVTKRSPTSGLSTFVMLLPSTCVLQLTWNCVEGLLSEKEISVEGMKMLNGVFRRYLKLKDGRKDLRQLLKKMLEHEPLQFCNWRAIHILICMSTLISDGEEIHLAERQASRLTELLSLGTAWSKTEDETFAFMESLGLLCYSIKAEDRSAWPNCSQVADWIDSAIELLDIQLQTARSLAGEGSNRERLRWLVSQCGAAMFKRRVLRESVQWDPIHKAKLLRMVSLLIELSDPSTERSESHYRAVPHDLRAMMDSALSYSGWMEQRKMSLAAIESYSTLLDVYALVHREWIQQKGSSNGCLRSKITGAAYRVWKVVQERDVAGSTEFFERAISYLVDLYEEESVEDVRKLVQKYCKKRASCPEGRCLLTRVVEISPSLKFQPEKLLRMSRAEAVALIVYRSDPDSVQNAAVSQLNVDYFRKENSPLFCIWMRILLSFVEMSNERNDPVEVTKQLDGLLRDLSRCPRSSSYLSEAKAIAKSIQFLVHAWKEPPATHQAPHQTSSGLLIRFPCIDFFAVEGEFCEEVDWAEEGNIRDLISDWLRIESVPEILLDPELDALILSLLRDLAHSRCWISQEKDLSDLLLRISQKHQSRISEQTRRNMQASLPIPYKDNISAADVHSYEQRMKALQEDNSVQGFQERLAVQLRLAKYYSLTGDMIKARQMSSDARGFALGLFKSFAEKGGSGGGGHPSCPLGSAWIARGLYGFCQLLIAEAALELEETTEGKFILLEAAKILSSLRSKRLACVVFMLSARFSFKEGDIVGAERQLRKARELLPRKSDLVDDFGLVQYMEIERRLAEAQMQRGQYDAASKTLKRSILRFTRKSDFSIPVQKELVRLSSLLAAAENQLTPLAAVASVIDFLGLSESSEECQKSFVEFLYHSAAWRTDLKIESGGCHVFGIKDIEDQFRQSLDLRSPKSERLSALRLKVAELKFEDKHFGTLRDILELSLSEDMVDTSMTELKIQFLLVAWNQCIELSSLFGNVSTVLGVLMAHCGYLHAAVYFLACSTGNGIRLQTIYNLKKKSEDLRNTSKARAALLVEPFELTTDVQFLEDIDRCCKRRMDSVMSCCQTGTTMVTMKLVTEGVHLKLLRGKILLGRYSPGLVPVVVVLPAIAPSLVDSMDVDETDDRSLFQGILGQLEEILAENRKIFETDHSRISENKTLLHKWWQDRLELDRNMGFVISSVDAALGPWKLLLKGYPTMASIGLPWNAMDLDQTTSQLLEHFWSVFVSRADQMSYKDREAVVDFFHKANGGSMNKFFLLEQLCSCTESATPVCSTPVKTPVPRKSRISRMRSTKKTDRFSSRSPTPTPVDSSKKIERFGTPIRKSILRDDAECGDPKIPGHPVLLLLDSMLHQFPWESLSCLQTESIYRLPNLSFVEYLTVLGREQS